jgi:hypothetical protein
MKLTRKELRETLFELRWFLTASVLDIFQLFSAEDEAICGQDWVFIPGTRKPADRILFVAHADTVRDTLLESKNLLYNREHRVFSAIDGDALGGDDRAGCAMLFRLIGSGHSILITDHEESGGKGADMAAKQLGVLLRQHAFMVEPDRYGNDEYIFYRETTNDDFSDYIASVVPAGWTEGWGSFTDISSLSPNLGLCGVNVSCGYYDQHSSKEMLYVDHWQATLDWLRATWVVDNLNLPDFDVPETRAWTTKSYRGWTGHDELWGDERYVPNKPYEGSMVYLADQSDKEVLELAYMKALCEDEDDWWLRAHDETDEECANRLADSNFENPLANWSELLTEVVSQVVDALEYGVHDSTDLLQLIAECRATPKRVFNGKSTALALVDDDQDDQDDLDRFIAEAAEEDDVRDAIPILDFAGDIVSWVPLGLATSEERAQGFAIYDRDMYGADA